jgi:hypothetical protein
MLSPPCHAPPAAHAGTDKVPGSSLRSHPIPSDLTAGPKCCRCRITGTPLRHPRQNPRIVDEALIEEARVSPTVLPICRLEAECGESALDLCQVELPGGALGGQHPRRNSNRHTQTKYPGTWDRGGSPARPHIRLALSTLILAPQSGQAPNSGDIICWTVWQSGHSFRAGISVPPIRSGQGGKSCIIWSNMTTSLKRDHDDGAPMDTLRQSYWLSARRCAHACIRSL